MLTNQIYVKFVITMAYTTGNYLLHLQKIKQKSNKSTLRLTYKTFNHKKFRL